MSKSNRKKNPSRVKYEQRRPTFSFRIYQELDDRLRAVKKAEGISNTNIVEAALDLFEVKIRKEKEIRDQAYDEGWGKGITAAIELYMVTYPCSVCGKSIELDSPEEKAAASRYMREHGWGHADCINRRR